MEHYQTFQIVSIIVSIIACFLVEPRWRRENPGKQPFRWGIFQGSNAIFAIVLCFLFPVLPYGDVLAVYGLGLCVCGVGMMMRRRWAWIAGTALTLNPILWCVNGVYLSNRWSEMKSEAVSRQRLAPPPVRSEVRVSTYQPVPSPPYFRHFWQRIQINDLRLVFAIVLVAGFLGAGAQAWLGDRYRFQALGNGMMMKSDRWTGNAWTLRRDYSGDRVREYWESVDDK